VGRTARRPELIRSECEKRDEDDQRCRGECDQPKVVPLNHAPKTQMGQTPGGEDADEQRGKDDRVSRAQPTHQRNHWATT
jgi:hypothetical protein